MTHADKKKIGSAFKAALSPSLKKRFKALHIMSHAHGGHLTMRAFFTNQAIKDPAPVVFLAEEL